VAGKAYDRVLWSCHHTGRFPRSHRFVLGERIERNLYDLLQTRVRARYTRERRPLLLRANRTLEVLRFRVRLARDLGCLTVKSYGFAARAVDEVGRLVGGWLEAVPGGPRPGRPAGLSPWPAASGHVVRWRQGLCRSVSVTEGPEPLAPWPHWGLETAQILAHQALAPSGECCQTHPGELATPGRSDPA
jgi:hypothetical protein